MSKFVYLLNAMENAASTDHPSKHGYAEKRQAVIDYVGKLQAGEAQGEWMPVGERLPDEDELVLVSVWCESDDHDGITQRWQEVHEATIYKTTLQLIATTADGNEYEGEEVEAWMPLPVPPSPTQGGEKAGQDGEK